MNRNKKKNNSLQLKKKANNRRKKGAYSLLINASMLAFKNPIEENNAKDFMNKNNLKITYFKPKSLDDFCVRQ